MSKRSASSVCLLAGGARLRKRVGSPASQSDSSSDLSVELDCDLSTSLLLTYAYIAPPPVGPASSVVEDDLVEWQRNVSGSAADDSFAAYQEAAKVVSAKRGSASRTVSGDDVVVTGSRRATVVKTEPTSLSHGRMTRGGGVMTKASHQSADIGRYVGILATALTNLNLSVFP
ncbi:hypothetical protein Bca52824_026993 [Brassica carinata]|uniref:Uncharacterized protein n=1 Tax=Brassica carinata TaxID=52824 RepID=A0A8X7V8G0_BRACI|nr:hypothetical protein Bca52824_026993 [Brassica carinata]